METNRINNLEQKASTILRIFFELRNPSRSLCWLMGLALIASPISALAQDIENGQKLARKCSVCHGKQGIAKDPEMPNLAGQSAFYLEKSIKDFQKGMREDRRMTLVVKDLTDSDIKDLAAWYASFVVTVTAPE